MRMFILRDWCVWDRETPKSVDAHHFPSLHHFPELRTALDPHCPFRRGRSSCLPVLLWWSSEMYRIYIRNNTDQREGKNAKQSTLTTSMDALFTAFGRIVEFSKAFFRILCWSSMAAVATAGLATATDAALPGCNWRCRSFSDFCFARSLANNRSRKFCCFFCAA